LSFDAFADALFAELELPPASAGADTMLSDELGFDSVLLFEMLLVIEDWTGVLLPEALLGQLLTVGDVYEVYRARRAQR
jgi:acyl carrier protein